MLNEQMSSVPQNAAATARVALSKVPEVTIYFWIIKILATTIGETAADFLGTNLGLGLNGTTLVMSIALAIALTFQPPPVISSRRASTSATGDRHCSSEGASR